MSHYVTFTPDEHHEPDAPSGDFTFECDEPEGAECRWSCDCEEWLIVMRMGSAWHFEGDGFAHAMEPSDCTIKPWFDEADFIDMLNELTDFGNEPLRPGRHQVRCTWEGDYFAFEYAELAAIDALKDKYTTDQGGMPK